MKSLLLLTAFLTFSLPCALPAQSAGVSVNVTQSVVPVHTEVKKKGPRIEVEKSTLTITLSNVSSAELKDLKVKYYVFATTAGSNGLDILKQGDLSASIPAGGTTKLLSDTVEASYTGQSYTKTGRVPPSGKKLAGFGARVMDSSGAVLGEFFSSESAKKAAK